MHRRQRKEQAFVIFAFPPPLKGPGTVYYAEDGTKTVIKFKAAKFSTREDAQDFAKKNNIELTAATYIDLEIF